MNKNEHGRDAIDKGGLMPGTQGLRRTSMAEYSKKIIAGLQISSFLSTIIQFVLILANGIEPYLPIVHILMTYSGIAYMIMLYKIDLWKNIEKTTKIWVFAMMVVIGLYVACGIRAEKTLWLCLPGDMRDIKFPAEVPAFVFLSVLLPRMTDILCGKSKTKRVYHTVLAIETGVMIAICLGFHITFIREIAFSGVSRGMFGRMSPLLAVYAALGILLSGFR